MRINKEFADSRLFWLYSTIFANSNKNFFQHSKILSALRLFNQPKLSSAFLILSLTCLFYESLFSAIGFGFIQSLNLGFAFLVFALIFCDKTRLRSTKSIMYLLTFMIILLVSGITAAINGLEFGMIINGVFIFSQFIFAFILTSTYVQKSELIDSILIISVPAILVGLYQGLFGSNTSSLWVSAAENLVDNRAYAFFGSPNILGSLVMLTIIMAIIRFFQNKKAFNIVYIVMSLPVLALTFSRSAWIGLGAGLVIILLAKNWKFIFISPAGLLPLLIPSIRQRVFVAISQSYMVDSALDGRVWSFNNALEVFNTSPIIGTGPGTYGGQTAIYYDSPVYLKGMQNGYVALPYTDNQWMQILVQSGVLGALSVALFFASHVINNLMQYNRTKNMLSLGIIAACVALIINGFFANIFEFGVVSVLAGSYLGLGNSYEE